MLRGIAGVLAARLSRFNQGSFYKNVAWVAGGTAAAQAITVLSTPVVTRLYTPSDYGVFSFFTAVLIVLQPLATLTYAMAIPLAEDRALAQGLLKLCAVIAASFSLALAGAVLLAGPWVAARFGMPEAAPFLWLLPVCVLGSGLYESLSYWAIRGKHFKAVSATQVSQGVSSAAVKIGLGFAGAGPIGLILGLVATSSAGCLSLFRRLIREEPEAARSLSWRELRGAAYRFRAFPQFRSWSRVLLGFNARLPVLLIAALYDPVAVGLYGLASSMVDLPMSLVGNSVSKVFYAEIAAMGKGRPDRILALSLSVLKRMCVLGILAATTLIAAGPWLFAAVFGEEWRDAGVYARWLALALATRFVSTPVMHCLDVLEMQGVQLALNIARGAMIAGAFVLAARWDYSPVEAVSVYAGALASYYALSIAGVLGLLRRRAARMGSAD